MHTARRIEAEKETVDEWKILENVSNALDDINTLLEDYWMGAEEPADSNNFWLDLEDRLMELQCFVTSYMNEVGEI